MVKGRALFSPHSLFLCFLGEGVWWLRVVVRVRVRVAGFDELSRCAGVLPSLSVVLLHDNA